MKQPLTLGIAMTVTVAYIQKLDIYEAYVMNMLAVQAVICNKSSTHLLAYWFPLIKHKVKSAKTGLLSLYIIEQFPQ